MSKRDEIQSRIYEFKTHIEQLEQKALEIAGTILSSSNHVEHIAKVENPSKMEQFWDGTAPRLAVTINKLNKPKDNVLGVSHNWDEGTWRDFANFQPPISGDCPTVVRIGMLNIPVGIGTKQIPALVPIRAIFQGKNNWHVPGHLVLQTRDERTRNSSLQLLQSLAVRLICTFPLRTMRGLFIDPVNMGSTFPVKGLPDYMAGPQVYTRADEIRQQLRALTQHVVEVTQRKLGSTYTNIEDYNEEKPLTREPYRYVFISDFPQGFDSSSQEDLVSLLKNGARAGVYIFIHVDLTKEYPSALKDYSIFDTYCTNISVSTNEYQKSITSRSGIEGVPKSPVTQTGLLSFKLPTGEQMTADADSAPSPEQLTALIKCVAEHFKNQRGESIPWSEFLPEDKQLWTGQSVDVIRAPIGVSNTRDHLEISFGVQDEGKIANNMLLAGRPGAGKSYTLHALICSLALRYHPNELELYLLDFKSGVEFQVYVDPNRYNEQTPNEEFNTSNSLPHAKVISIDSEREFGLSVLRRLNQELEKRGKLFAAEGTEGLSLYRKKHPEIKMPRVVAIFDEFQRIFEKNDAISRESNTLIEILVRQGRAFGIHMVFATQSPSIEYFDKGIYSFIDIRMAHLMDEVSAFHTLAKDNVDAVHLLEKSGDVLYNPRMGTRGYDEYGKTAFISPEARRDTMQKIQQLVISWNFERNEPLILFDGRQSAQLKHNPYLNTLGGGKDWLSSAQLNKQILKDPNWIPEQLPIPVWIGESAFMGNHTVAIFRRRSRSNLLLAGNSEKVIYGMLSSLLISLVHCYAPKQVVFYAIDLATESEDAPWANMMPTFYKAFRNLYEITLGKRTVDAERGIVRRQLVWDKLIEEFTRRQTLRETNPDEENFGPSIFFIYAIGSLARADWLRPEQDKGGKDVPSDNAKQLLDLVSKGPELGIHTILWLEDMRAFTRIQAENRAWISNFDLRVALRLNAEDSRILLKDVDAEKLPQYRALLLDDAGSEGMQKFKPYGVLTDAEIQTYAQLLQQRLT